MASKDGKNKDSQEHIEKSDTQEYFDSLFKRITSKKSREAADGLFAATDEELGKSFNPTTL